MPERDPSVLEILILSLVVFMLLMGVLLGMSVLRQMR